MRYGGIWRGQALHLNLRSENLGSSKKHPIRERIPRYPDELSSSLRDHECLTLVESPQEVRVDSEPLLGRGAPPTRWANLPVELTRDRVGLDGARQLDDLLGFWRAVKD